MILQQSRGEHLFGTSGKGAERAPHAAGIGPAAPLCWVSVRAVGVYFPANGRFYHMGGRRADPEGSDFTNPFEYNPATSSWFTKSATYPDNQDTCTGFAGDPNQDNCPCTSGEQSPDMYDSGTTVYGGEITPEAVHGRLIRGGIRTG